MGSFGDPTDADLGGGAHGMGFPQPPQHRSEPGGASLEDRHRLWRFPHLRSSRGRHPISRVASRAA